MLSIGALRGALTAPWLSNALWKNARAVPSLDLRFADDKSLVDAKTGASLVTFTRASSGTYVGSDGLIKSATTNEARFDHNPTTGESLGLLVEEARTNLLLNSATLSTQSVTVAATANTLSFYGTGTVTLTGVSTAGPLVGTGVNNRVSLTFTPTVGLLVLTVSGSVTNAQLEAGAFPTSYIPTTSSTATRAADVASITGTNFSSWYQGNTGTLFFEGINPAISTSAFAVSDGSTNNRLQMETGTNTRVARVVSGGTTQAGNNIAYTYGASQKFAMSYVTNSINFANAGTLGTEDTSATIPTVDQARIGANPTGANPLNNTIKRLTYWPVRLANTTLQSITTP